MIRPRIWFMAILSMVLLLAGVAVAMAAHPDVPTLKAGAGNIQAGPADAYSPKQTCGGCHFNCGTLAYDTNKANWCQTGQKKDCSVKGNCPDYESLATVNTNHTQGMMSVSGGFQFLTDQTYTITSPQHGVSTGFHSQHGRNEELTAAQREIWGAFGGANFISTPGMFGRYCPPSNRQLSAKNLTPGLEATQVEMSPSNWAKSCGVCHTGGGSMEYDRDMNAYSGTSASGDRFTWLIPTLANPTGRIVDISTTPSVQSTQLYGSNKAEVDCLICHMNTLKTGAAWYKNTLNCVANGGGPSDNPNCGPQKMTPFGPMPDDRFTFTAGAIYDPYNRNIAVSLGYLAQAASAGIGAGVNLTTGVLNGTPLTIGGSNIAAIPNSGNCAVCHARNEADNLGLPGMDQGHGGMIVGYGNFIRQTPAGQAFDWDKLTTAGGCKNNDCSNATLWTEFGCKTGMGKRSQKTGIGSSDRFGNGFCLVCDMMNQWGNPMSFCALPSVQSSCIAKTGIPTLISDNNPYTLIDMTVGAPMKVPGKLSDTDVHDASAQGIKCGSCHYSLSGSVPARTVTATFTPDPSTGISYSASYTYPATTFEKMDHNLAKGFSILEKGGDQFDGSLTCESCHITQTHPNVVNGTVKPPVPTHSGFPALHLEKIDCRTCHIPYVYSSPGRLLFRDWTAGAYRQTEGSNGNANHFDFAFNFLEGSMAPMAPIRAWLATPEGTKITPYLPTLLPMWAGATVTNSDINGNPVPTAVLGYLAAKTRDVTAAAALVSANHPEFNIRLDGTNEHPLFQGFQLTDPWKIDSKAKIDAMAAELSGLGAGYASHASYTLPRMNLNPTLFDPSHGVVEKENALGGVNGGGCVMCHSSSAVNPMTGQPMDPATYSPNSVGFFDGKKELMKNGMMQAADFDCDNPMLFQAMTGGTPTNPTPLTCTKIYANDPMFGGDGQCDGTQPGTDPTTGQANGTLGICKQSIGMALVRQFGMTPDPAFRMDGIDFMQMMAIREGASARGCNPMMQMFGLPTNCNPMTDIYSRAEIRSHFQKNLQQSIFSMGGAAGMPHADNSGPVPAFLGRVYSKVGYSTPQLAKNPSNGDPAYQPWFDMGATCYDSVQDPLHMMGITKPCADGDYIVTAVSETQLLGYTGAYRYYLMSLVLNPTSCNAPVAKIAMQMDPSNPLKVNFDASASTNANTYTWTFGDGSTATGATVSHTYAACDSNTVTLTVTGPCGPENTATSQVTLNCLSLARMAYMLTPVDYQVVFDGSKSLNFVTCVWNFGDGSPIVNGCATTHIYAGGGTYTASLTVSDGKGNSNTTSGQVNVDKLKPVARIKMQFDATTPWQVDFDGSTSLYAHSYSWNFGDGSPIDTTSGALVNHIYTAKGTYYPKLTVTGITGLTNTATAPVTIK